MIDFAESMVPTSLRGKPRAGGPVLEFEVARFRLRRSLEGLHVGIRAIAPPPRRCLGLVRMRDAMTRPPELEIPRGWRAERELGRHAWLIAPAWVLTPYLRVRDVRARLSSSLHSLLADEHRGPSRRSRRSPPVVGS